MPRPDRCPLFLLAFFWASAALAEAVPPGDPDAGLKAEWEAQFRAADADQDRRLSRDEAAAGLPKMLWKRFDDVDLDGDEHLTPEELWAMHEREVQAREERRARRMAGKPGR